MAARFPSGPPLKLATDSTLGAVGSTGTGGYPGADAGKKGGPRVDALKKDGARVDAGKGGSQADAGKKDGPPEEEGTLREVLAAISR